jgi:tRNA-specific 2-thiouridylase
VDTDGVVLGSHDGSYGFTIGQRKGLALGRPAADGRPRYVLSIEPVSHTVVVGPPEALDVREIEAARPVWSGCAPPSDPLHCLVQLRAHGEVYPAVCEPAGERVRVLLREPARGVAAGQAAVFYDGDAVLGSATISSTTRSAA